MFLESGFLLWENNLKPSWQIRNSLFVMLLRNLKKKAFGMETISLIHSTSSKNSENVVNLKYSNFLERWSIVDKNHNTESFWDKPAP